VRRAAVSRQRQRARGLDERAVRQVSEAAFGGLLHHKQVLSIALVTLGVLYTAKMTIHAIGTAMARARGRVFPKHGIKQVDRYMSNGKIAPVDVRRGLVWFVVGDRKEIEATMDWTDFDKDDQTTLVISLVLKHGRAIPLVWLNVRKSEIEGRRSMHEKTAVQELGHALPDGVRVTLLADRGFGDTKLFDHLEGIDGFDFVIRFKKCYLVAAEGYRGKAGDAVPRNGRVRSARRRGRRRAAWRSLGAAWCPAVSWRCR